MASEGHSSSRCAGLSLSWPLLLRSTGSRRAGSVIVAHGPSCSAACGIFSDQGSNPCPPHWQADSQPLRHQGSPYIFGFIACAFGVNSKKSFSSPMSRSFTPVFFKELFGLRSYVCLSSILSWFCVLCKIIDQLNSFAREYLAFPTPFVEDSFSHYVFLAHLLKVN